jgi:trans-aconitate methyltransferase
MPKNIKQSSHWNGYIYSQISSPQYIINSEFLSKHTFNADEIVLDIGCGNGKTTQKIAEKIPNGKIVGVDASSSMIECANKENHSLNCSFKLIDAQEINFKNAFDLCTCFFCMQWIPDKASTIQKIADSLKQNGVFLMIVPLPHAHLPAIRNDLIKTPRWEKYFENYQDPLVFINDTEYKKYIENTGLFLKNYDIEETPVLFKDYDTFFQFMSQMTPHLGQIPNDNEKDEFMHELIREYLIYYPQKTDGSYELIYTLLFVIANNSSQKM